MTRKDALDILGLKEDASAEDIKAAYKKLMKKSIRIRKGQNGWRQSSIRPRIFC